MWVFFTILYKKVWMCELEFQFIPEFTVEFSTKHHLLAICKHEIISRFGNIVPSSLCDGRVPRRASVACQLLFSDQFDSICLFVIDFVYCFVFCFVYVLLQMAACQEGHQLLVSLYFLTCSDIVWSLFCICVIIWKTRLIL